MVRYCCVPGCLTGRGITKSGEKLTTLHAFPRNPEVRKIWIQRIACEKIIKNPEKAEISTVCHLHFHRSSYSRSSCRLVPASLPTLNLPSFIADTKRNRFMSKNIVEYTSKSKLPISTKQLLELLECDETLTPSLGDADEQTDRINGALSRSSADEACYILLEEQLDDDVFRGFEIKRGLDEEQDDSARIEGLSAMVPQHKENRSFRALKKCSQRIRSKYALRITQRLLRISKLFYRTHASIQKTVWRIERELKSPQQLEASVDQHLHKYLTLRYKLPKQVKKKFSLNDKIAALSLLKFGRKTYRLLQRFFALPDRSSLYNLLRNTPSIAGVDESAMEQIKMSLNKRSDDYRLCSILMQDTPLNPGLQYSLCYDSIVGLGANQGKCANRALVFTAHGIARTWKQPIAYYFLDGVLNALHLAELLKKVIQAAQSSGLQVMCVVTDHRQSHANVYDIILEKNNANPSFIIGGQEIVLLHDPPTLLKSLRNKLLQSPVDFKWKHAHAQTANWEDIIQFLKADRKDPEWSMYKHLKPVDFSYIPVKAMEIRTATHIFNRKLASLLMKINEINCVPMLPTAKDTASFLLFATKLSDSLNGGSAKSQDSNGLKCAVTKRSQHADFWREAQTVLKTFSFHRGKEVPSFVASWIHTLKGFDRLWLLLRRKGLKTFRSRQISLCAIENFFDMIKLHGAHGKNPNCLSFLNSFKSVILSNYKCRSRYKNGGNNISSGLLSKVKLSASVKSDHNFGANHILIKQAQSFKDSYSARIVAKRILKRIKGCPICCSAIYSSTNVPTLRFLTVFNETMSILKYHFPLVCHLRSVREKCLQLLYGNVNTIMSMCNKHNIRKIIINVTLDLYMLYNLKRTSWKLHHKKFS